MIRFIFAFSIKGLFDPLCREHLLERWVSATKCKFHFTLPKSLLLFRTSKFGPPLCQAQWNESYLPPHFSCLFNTHSALSLLILSQPLLTWQCQLKHVQWTHNSKLLGSAAQDNLKKTANKYCNTIFTYVLSDNLHCGLNSTTVKFFESLNKWYSLGLLVILDMFWHFGSKHFFSMIS